MANKFLGEAGLNVLVEEIKKKSSSASDFEVWFNQLKKLADFDNDMISEVSTLEYMKLIPSFCVLQIPSLLTEYLHEWFEDCPDYREGIDSGVISKTISMFDTILQDSNNDYYILWGLPMVVAVQDNALWSQLIAPIGFGVDEITAQEVTNKFNS